MRPVYDLHGGKPKDYTDTLIAKCDECIKSLECVKGEAHDDRPATSCFGMPDEMEYRSVERGQSECCGDNRDAVIGAAKKHILESTNIETSFDEMKCLDSFLFRCWQMKWLRDFDDTKPKYNEMRKALEKVKDAFETDTIYAPTAHPSHEMVDAVRKVYKTVLDALRLPEKPLPATPLFDGDNP